MTDNSWKNTKWHTTTFSNDSKYRINTWNFFFIYINKTLVTWLLILNCTILEYDLNDSLKSPISNDVLHHSVKQILTDRYWLTSESDWRRYDLLLSLSCLNCYLLSCEFYLSYQPHALQNIFFHFYKISETWPTKYWEKKQPNPQNM